jgi:hypothetical protein
MAGLKRPSPPLKIIDSLAGNVLILENTAIRPSQAGRGISGDEFKGENLKKEKM